MLLYILGALALIVIVFVVLKVIQAAAKLFFWALVLWAVLAIFGGVFYYLQ
ncbi:hypothetical protein [Mycoplasma sp. Ms02]|uniref:hypothetical protein n=1 Tax=Mycoplasma sp. Ms02 TaxID=353851 RepID=UPI001C8AC404|nr:hypothetical protein [Mycoplasma sp. Ms02]QZE12655.1 hypothetical protein K4L35_01565 [Mycoplasma sp. Ms02]